MKQTQQMALAMLALMVAGWAPTACAHDGAAERGVAAEQETAAQQETTPARQETTAAVRGTPARQGTPAARGTAAQQGTAPEEIAVTGVIKDAPDKWDGTPTYGITDETTITGRAPPVGYLLEGDYSAYEGRRVTVHGTPRHEQEMRVLDVSWVEQPQ